MDRTRSAWRTETQSSGGDGLVKILESMTRRGFGDVFPDHATVRRAGAHSALRDFHPNSAGRSDDAAQVSESPTGALGTASQRVIGVIVLLVALGVLVAPRMSVNRYDVTAAFVGLLGVITLWVVFGGLSRGKFPIPDRVWDAVAALLCVVMAGVSAVFAYWGAYETTWDPYVIKATVFRPSTLDVVAHFSVYPNMRPFLAVARTVRSWTAGTRIDYEAAFAALNSVSLLVTAVALYLTVRRIAGPARGVLALVLLAVLLGTTPWLSVPYTDMLTLWAPIVAVALFVAAQRHGRLAGRLVLASAAGASLAIGYALKVTPVVGLAALVLTLAISATARGLPVGRRVQLLTLGSCALAAFLVTVPSLGVWVRATDGLPPLHSEWAATPLTYVAEGLRTQASIDGGPTLYGAFDRQVVEQTKRKDAAAQNEIALLFIRRQWERRGLVGTAGFEVDKTLFNWGDGTFWARGEGVDAAAPALRSGPVADAVMAWNAPGRRLFRLHVLVAQVTWMAVLVALGVGLLRSRFRPEFLLMALTVAGIATFTLLFQGRSRYLLVDVPVILALAVSVVPRPAAWGPSRQG